MQKQPIINIPYVIIALVVFCVLAYFIPHYLFDLSQNKTFVIYFAFIPQIFTLYFSELFYTPISYSFMHGNIMHLTLNMVWLVVFGSPLANRIGAWRFLLFWAICAIFAAFTHYFVYMHSMIPMVGASGAISGLMGAAARYGFRRVQNYEENSRPEFAGPILSVVASLKSSNVIVFIVAWLVINFITGFLTVGVNGQSIAWQAHIGGLAAGFLLAGIFDRRSRNL